MAEPSKSLSVSDVITFSSQKHKKVSLEKKKKNIFMDRADFNWVCKNYSINAGSAVSAEFVWLIKAIRLESLCVSFTNNNHCKQQVFLDRQFFLPPQNAYIPIWILLTNLFGVMIL